MIDSMATNSDRLYRPICMMESCDSLSDRLYRPTCMVILQYEPGSAVILLSIQLNGKSFARDMDSAAILLIILLYQTLMVTLLLG